MEEAISHSLSTMLPLLGLLAVLGGGLITLALVLRFRMRRQMGARSVSVTSVTNTKKGDLLSVLGRTFTVERVYPINPNDDGFLWVCLSSDETSTRIAFIPQGGKTVSFPGEAQPSAQVDFPSTVSMGGKDYKKNYHLKDTAELEVSLYAAEDSGFWLALENRQGSMLAWRGKEIPSEGVTVLQD